MAGAGAALDGGAVQAVYVQLVADLGHEFQLALMQAAISGGNITGHGIGGFIEHFRQRRPNDAKQRVQPVLNLEKVKHHLRHLLGARGVIFSKNRHMVNDAGDAEQLGIGDILVRSGFSNHQRDQRVLRGKRGELGFGHYLTFFMPVLYYRILTRTPLHNRKRRKTCPSLDDGR